MSQGTTEGGQDPANGGAAGQGQDPAGNTGQGQAPGAGQGQQGQDPAGQQGGQINLDAITDPATRAAVEASQAELARARADAARYRTERNANQQTLADLQKANETAEQTATREAEEARQRQATEATRLQDLETENRNLRIGSAVTDAARDARAFNPGLVSQMVRENVTLGDDGKPTNVADLITALKESDPYLFRRSRNDAGAGAGEGAEPPPAGGINDVIRGQVAARRGRPTT